MFNGSCFASVFLSLVCILLPFDLCVSTVMDTWSVCVCVCVCVCVRACAHKWVHAITVFFDLISDFILSEDIFDLKYSQP